MNIPLDLTTICMKPSFDAGCATMILMFFQTEMRAKEASAPHVTKNG